MKFPFWCNRGKLSDVSQFPSSATIDLYPWGDVKNSLEPAAHTNLTSTFEDFKQEIGTLSELKIDQVRVETISMQSNEKRVT